MTAIKEFLHLNFSYLPILIVFGLGVVTGIVTFVRLIKKCLSNYRAQTIYTIIGMMIGSLYSIVNGPTTLSEPQEAMTFSTFSIGFFILGIAILVILQGLKFIMDKEEIEKSN